jgi:branched-subunit amino acid ABC-type transport system permease component
LNELLQQLVNGVAWGSIYALIALGYTMVYGVLRLINFAHGDVYMVGAMAGYYFATRGAPSRPLGVFLYFLLVTFLFTVLRDRIRPGAGGRAWRSPGFLAMLAAGSIGALMFRPGVDLLAAGVGHVASLVTGLAQAGALARARCSSSP